MLNGGRQNDVSHLRQAIEHILSYTLHAYALEMFVVDEGEDVVLVFLQLVSEPIETSFLHSRQVGIIVPCVCVAIGVCTIVVSSVLQCFLESRVSRLDDARHEAVLVLNPR